MAADAEAVLASRTAGGDVGDLIEMAAGVHAKFLGAS